MNFHASLLCCPSQFPYYSLQLGFPERVKGSLPILIYTLGSSLDPVLNLACVRP